MTKIRWVDTARRFCLSARERVYDDQPMEYSFVTEEDMLAVAEWCMKNNCGRRISFDMVQFKNKKEMTMFLMRWS